MLIFGQSRTEPLSAASMRAAVDGCVWNSNCDEPRWRSSARFCAARRFIALMKATEFLVISSA